MMSMKIAVMFLKARIISMMRMWCCVFLGEEKKKISLARCEGEEH